MAVGRRRTGAGAHRSVETPLRRGAAVVAVTGGAFALVGAASPASSAALVDAPVVPAAQAPAPTDILAAQAVLAAAADGVRVRSAVEPVDPDPDVVDASDLVKAVQLAEQIIARIDAERAAAEERAAQQRAEAEARQRADAARAAVGGDCGIKTPGLGAVRSHVRTAAQFLGCRYGEPDMYGVAGRAGTSDHPGGLAVDFMVNRATGDSLANCALKNMDELGIKYVIWEQRINYGSGWSAMEDRGGVTANHFDHVHISFDASRGRGDLRGC
ncbi:hypothetical protein [Pseudonocardia aurantiaca]|uniref:ARB-07466-like C-terminal domain-containing protein n=1 Tax=Pseudonocardia aurantiaca TaxID=75290 RepID=A0ABW4FEW2_9PSEU